MLNIHALQARFGDCLLLEAGGSAKRFVLIDGGPPDTFADDLEPTLKTLVGVGKALDLVVLSHVDNDHVIGLLDLFAALQESHTNRDEKPLVRVGRLWHNSFGRTIDPNGEILQRLQVLLNVSGTAGVAMPLSADAFFGIREGYRLRTLAAQLSLPINADFEEDTITVETAPKAVVLGELRLRVVGPTKGNLEALREEWLQWLEKNEQRILRDPGTAANSDRSIPNLSSIVLLAEVGGKTALLTGDARGDHIEQGLQQAGLSRNGRFHVNLFKLQHHGSDRNVVASFFERITADTYLVSADGRYDNPDYHTLKWIVQAAKKQNRAIRIVATNATPATQKLVKDLPPKRYGYSFNVRDPSQHYVSVPVG